eukprot:TRINITY_DN4318_c0_g2_i1.p1 TRINITY_DN4318_c0_g2~~TRINITY_DN4318_c0_g2_i1.p1  ORF type:complete len:339 (+),score=91.76 TRINITY_DN4318_c0_g2_i1:84-1019(+)
MAALDHRTAQECGIAFIMTYYDKFCHAPGELPKMYGAPCLMIREGTGKHMVHTAATTAEVSRILDEDVPCEQTKVRIMALNAVPDGPNVVVVVRAAVLTPSTYQPLNQTFILAGAGAGGAYQIVTDIMQCGTKKVDALERHGPAQAPKARTAVEPKPSAEQLPAVGAAEERPAVPAEEGTAHALGPNCGEKRKLQRILQRKRRNLAAAEDKAREEVRQSFRSELIAVQKSAQRQRQWPKNAPAGMPENSVRPKGKAKQHVDWSNAAFPPLGKPAVTPRVSAAHAAPLPVARLQWQEVVRRNLPSERSGSQV